VVALIAGSVAVQSSSGIEDVRQLVCRIPVVHGESNLEYVHGVLPIRFGHLVTKYKRTHPSPPQVVCDVEGNVLVVLGYVVPHVDPQHLLARAVKSSGQVLENCEGEFVAVFADGRTGVVHVVNDRFSSRPFYIAQREGGFYFSSNPTFLLALARARYRPDVIGWMQVSTVQHTIGERTTIEGVSRLRPATHLTLTPEQRTERQYWRLEHQPDPGLSPSSHSNDVFAAFNAGAERRSHLIDRGVLALSGGLDSRLVAGSVARNANVSAFTFVDQRGADSTPDTRAAAAVCQALGVRHRIERLPARFSTPREVVELTGGMRPYQHMAIALAYVHELQREGGCMLLGGGPGDVLAGSYVPSPAYVSPGRVSECMDDAFRRRIATNRHWRLIYRDEVIQGSGRAVKDSLEESLAESRGPTAAHRITAWGMTHRQPAFTFTSVFHTHPDVTEMVCHLDYRYSDLMLQLPAEWLYGRAFYAYMIYTCLPHLRHVPYANTGAVLSGQLPDLRVKRTRPELDVLTSIYSFGRRALGRVVRAVSRTPRIPSLIFSDTTLVDEVVECLHSTPALSDIVDVKRCDALLAQARGADWASEEALGSLTSLCLSFRALEFNDAA
jgi:Asparagine synthase/Glutamine amidotransferase domain